MMNKGLLALVTALFGVYSLAVVWDLGYLGMWQSLLDGQASRQALVDLVITSLLLLGLLWRDAQQTGRRFWPYVLLTLASGAFGPLLYLLLAPAPQAAPPVGSKSASAPGRP